MILLKKFEERFKDGTDQLLAYCCLINARLFANDVVSDDGTEAMKVFNHADYINDRIRVLGRIHDEVNKLYNYVCLPMPKQEDKMPETSPLVFHARGLKIGLDEIHAMLNETAHTLFSSDDVEVSKEEVVSFQKATTYEEMLEALLGDLDDLLDIALKIINFFEEPRPSGSEG